MIYSYLVCTTIGYFYVFLRHAQQGSFTVYTAEDDVAAVSDALTAKGYTLLSAQVEMLPQNGYVKLADEDQAKGLQKMLDLLEDNDDVQNVWHNWEDAE